MKIAFWSMQRGRNGVTSNLACTCILSNMRHERRMMLFENHPNIQNLGNILFCQNSNDFMRENINYGKPHGLEQLLRQFDQGVWMNEDQLVAASYVVPGKKIFYLPRYLYSNPDYMEYELQQYLPAFLETVESFCETVYIDVSGNQNHSTRELLRRADMVVINLSQDPYILDEIFQNFSEIRRKAFYLISNYDEHSIYHRDRILKEYKIPQSHIGVIPYNVRFANAIAEGRLISFLQSNYSCQSSNINYEFIKEAKRSVEKMDYLAFLLAHGGGRTSL